MIITNPQLQPIQPSTVPEPTASDSLDWECDGDLALKVWITARRYERVNVRMMFLVGFLWGIIVAKLVVIAAWVIA